MNTEKQFAQGLFFKLPHPKAPTFVKGGIAIKVDEFIEFLQANKKGEWINIDVKESKGGKLYCTLNTYEKGENTKSQFQKDLETPNQEIPVIYENGEVNPADIPF